MMFSRFVVLIALLVTAVLAACTPPPLTSAPTVMPTRTAVPTATALFAGLDLTTPGWIHTIEQYHDSTIATLDPQTQQIAMVHMDYEVEQWQRLDEAGLVVEMVSMVRDMDGEPEAASGRDLQLSTFHDGVLRNLTFNMNDPVDPWPLPWAQSYFEWLPEVELLLAERVDTLPPEALALLETEATNLVCDPLREADEADGGARLQFDALYTGWLDSLAAQAQDPTPRWLHVIITRIQNEATPAHDPEADQYPVNYTNDQWLWLNEQGLAEKSVGIIRDEKGKVIRTYVERDGRTHDFTTDQTYAGLPQRPSLDLDFSGNAGSFIWLQQETVDGEPAAASGHDQLIFTACQNYDGGLPMIGELPVAIVGGQRWLWVDAQTGAVIRTEWRYVDATGQSHLDWQEEITLLEFVDQPPPEIIALLGGELEE